jgi:SAM-dependent methyltransferase
VTPEPAATVLLAPGHHRGVRVPWWAKIILKLVLARLPVPHAWWRKIGVFRHGCLAEDVERRGADVLRHVARYRTLCAAPLRRVVEIGPGDSIASALWTGALGAEETWLIDVGQFAVDDPAHYRAAIECIAHHGLEPPVLAAPGGIGAVLSATGAVYRTDGLAAFAALANGSVDFVFSQAVLEHLPLDQFDRFLGESFRVLRPGSVASHVIDLEDHLGGALNHLRFSRTLWEWSAISRSGFYTNRLRASEICRIAVEAGFIVSVAQLVRWSALPTPRSALNREFQAFPDEELAIAGLWLVLLKPQPATEAFAAP